MTNSRSELGMIERTFAAVQAKRGGRVVIRHPVDVLALMIATGGGAGFAPVVPATFGSIVGVALVCGLVARFRPQPELLPLGILLSSVALFVVGVWAATRAERIFRKKDAGQVVIDEVCGQVMTYAAVAFTLAGPVRRAGVILAAGFLLFRLFDILKPFPIRRLESLGAGLGVMADDVLAGLYAAAALSLVHYVWM